jgi:hypothetical protein
MNSNANEPAGAGLVFGIFPGMIGTEPGLCGGPPYDPERTASACGMLHAPGQSFIVRSYEGYHGRGQTSGTTPGDLPRYVAPGRRIDHVLCYRSPDGDLDDWTAYVRAAIREHGPLLDALQVTEEPNNPDPKTGGDGSSPRVLDAIVAGVIAAREEADRLGLDLRVGFNACPAFDPAQQFWSEIAARGGQAFRDALGYVGFDFFPDVFRPIAFESLAAAVEGVLTGFRTVSLPAGGIPESVPIRITENGWPTGPGRSEEKQAAVLETVVRKVHALRQALNITHYEFFSLRGGNSTNPDSWTQFGLVRDDYTPKQAFEVYRRLVAELGR